jgi:hypothetical protein
MRGEGLWRNEGGRGRGKPDNLGTSRLEERGERYAEDNEEEVDGETVAVAVNFFPFFFTREIALYRMVEKKSLLR